MHISIQKPAPGALFDLPVSRPLASPSQVSRLPLHAARPLSIFHPCAEALRYRDLGRALSSLPIDTLACTASTTALPHHLWCKADITNIEDAVHRACDEMSPGSLAFLASSLRVRQLSVLLSLRAILTSG